jgi:hypothetical protein
MSSAIEKKLDIAEEKNLNPLLKSVLTFLHSKSGDKQLLDDALLAIEMFTLKEVALSKVVQSTDILNKEQTKSVLADYQAKTADSEVKALHRKEQLASAQNDFAAKENCSKLVQELDQLPQKRQLTDQLKTAMVALSSLKESNESWEEKLAKRMRRFEYIVNLASELRT